MTSTPLLTRDDNAPANEEPPVADASGTAPVAKAAPSRPTGARLVVRRGLLAFGCAVLAFVVFAVWLSAFAYGRAQTRLQREFSTALENAQAPISGAIDEGTPVAIIDAPDIGLHATVVAGTSSDTLRSGPGHLIGTPLPGQPGNPVIAGRRTLYGGPFARIGELREGARITTTTGQGRATYTVTDVRTYDASDAAFLLNQGDDRLTLFTSGSRWNADSRLVVTADRRGEPFAPTALRRTLDVEHLGLTGDRDDLAPLLLWLELLAVIAIGAALALSRWRPIVTWLTFAPALALALWLVFEQATRLLPATL